MSIARFREVGNAEGIATTMADLGAVRLAQGDLSEARRLLEGSLPNYRAVEDKEGVALTLNNLGDLSRQSGNLQAAETNYRQAKEAAEEIENTVRRLRIEWAGRCLCRPRRPAAGSQIL